MMTGLETLHNLACALYVAAHPYEFRRASGIDAEIKRLSNEALALVNNELLLAIDLLTGKLGYDRAARKFNRSGRIT